MISKIYFVFDVESIGLHGEAFAVGYTVINSATKQTLAKGLIACEPQLAKGEEVDFEWVVNNIPVIPSNASSPKAVRHLFWKEWLYWKSQEAIMVADCGWPVEARFLLSCIDDGGTEDHWNGPYPLIDLSSVLLAKGKDPVGKFLRLPSEYPEHNPLNDACQSARVLLENL